MSLSCTFILSSARELTQQIQNDDSSRKSKHRFCFAQKRRKIIPGSEQTFDQFAPIDLAGSDLKRYDVILLGETFQLLLIPFNAEDMTTGSCRT